jgi:hypothetical protein
MKRCICWDVTSCSPMKSLDVSEERVATCLACFSALIMKIMKAMFLLNVRRFSTDYTALYPIRWNSGSVTIAGYLHLFRCTCNTISPILKYPAGRREF